MTPFEGGFSKPSIKKIQNQDIFFIEKSAPKPVIFIEPRDLHELFREKWHLYADMVQQFINNPKFYIDRGGVGEVFALGTTGFCVKLIKDRHNKNDTIKYDLGNTIEQEGKFLKHMIGLEVKGARSPYYFDVLKGEGYGALIMEQLSAVNLQKVITGEAELPDNFSFDTFFSSLESYVDKMHETRGVTHGDLFARNIMIDSTTALPYLIDFGRAHDLRKVTDFKRESLIQADWNELDKVTVDVEKLTK
jgi:tRNA A-37 threonylcarbamoyl transferase component Bud32